MYDCGRVNMLYGSGVNVMPKSKVFFIISYERHTESQWGTCLKASMEYNVRALARDPFATVPPINLNRRRHGTNRAGHSAQWLARLRTNSRQTLSPFNV